MNKDKKGHVDLDSAHDKLADNYKIDKNINSKVSTSIKDFKSVSDTINKFEKIRHRKKIIFTFVIFSPFTLTENVLYCT